MWWRGLRYFSADYLGVLPADAKALNRRDRGDRPEIAEKNAPTDFFVAQLAKNLSNQLDLCLSDSFTNPSGGKRGANC
jgi:hypothetical protein